MSVSRHIPQKVKSEVLREAGHRCGIPTCGVTHPLEFEHITDWAKLDLKEHLVENLIPLCANCHSKVTRGEIPKDDIRQYKSNLVLLSHRYSLFEIRILRAFYENNVPGINPEDNTGRAEKALMVNMSDQFHLSGMLHDGFMKMFDMNNGEEAIKDDKPNSDYPNNAMLVLTKKGAGFCRQIFEGRSISYD